MDIDLSKLTGIDRLRVQRLAKLETGARLFDMAGYGAAADGRLDDWERYQQRSGWLGGKFLNEAREVRSLVVGDGGLIVDAVQAAREVSGSET